MRGIGTLGIVQLQRRPRQVQSKRQREGIGTDLGVFPRVHPRRVVDVAAVESAARGGGVIAVAFGKPRFERLGRRRACHEHRAVAGDQAGATSRTRLGWALSSSNEVGKPSTPRPGSSPAKLSKIFAIAAEELDRREPERAAEPVELGLVAKDVPVRQGPFELRKHRQRREGGHGAEG
jgi:hypothetical protein